MSYSIAPMYDINLVGDPKIKKLASVIERAKEKVAKRFNISKYLFKNDYEISRLPEIYEIGVGVIGGYLIPYIRRVGKILGTFNPFNRRKTFDPENFSNDRRLEESTTHELIHEAQYLTGRIHGRSREEIEREAYSETRKIMNS